MKVIRMPSHYKYPSCAEDVEVLSFYRDACAKVGALVLFLDGTYFKEDLEYLTQEDRDYFIE